jgi:hypothetical protein
MRSLDYLARQLDRVGFGCKDYRHLEHHPLQQLEKQQNGSCCARLSLQSLMFVLPQLLLSASTMSITLLKVMSAGMCLSLNFTVSTVTSARAAVRSLLGCAC